VGHDGDQRQRVLGVTFALLVERKVGSATLGVVAGRAVA